MKNFVAFVSVLTLIIGGIWLYMSNQADDPNLISTKGIHWHPVVTIIVKGEKQIIPPNIGIGSLYASSPTFDRRMGMTAVHTHDDASVGIIHFEFDGIVRKEDLTLGRFLTIWGKDINSFGQNPKMTVNGVESLELENYSMKDGDQVVLNYE